MTQIKIERNEYMPLYVSKEEKASIEAAKDNHALQMEIIKTVFASEKNFLQSEMSMVEDELLKYRAFLLTVRQEYKKAQDEHCEKLEEMWSEIHKGLPVFKEKVSCISNEIIPLINTVKQLSKEFENINTYRIKDLMELVQKFNGMGTEGREMFTYLAEKFGKQQ